MHRLIYIDYAYVFMYSITKTLYIMQLRLKKRLTFYVYRRKIAVKSLFIMLFFKEKKPLDFIQNWVLLLYGSWYQNIYSIAYIFRITHPVRFFEKLIRGWWALFGWLHVNYQYQYRLHLIFYGDSYKYQDTFLVNRPIFFETLFFFCRNVLPAPPPGFLW